MRAEKVSTGPLQTLRTQGQTIWLDFIRRDLITSGGLRRLIDDDGLTGVTSNPSTFEKAILGSTEFDEALGRLMAGHAVLDPRTLDDQIVIEDVRMAADVLRRVYDESSGADGFVSIEPRRN